MHNIRYMKIQKGMGDFFALDIGTNAVRVLQLAASGQGSWNLVAYGYVPVDHKITASDSPEARRRLGEATMTAVGQSGIRTKNVAIGLPSSKTFTTVIDVPAMIEAELRATMKYQVDQYIPMSSDEAKVDWALLGGSLKSQNQNEVLITSVSKQYSEERLELIESLGLNVIAEEPDPLAMVRALVPATASNSAYMLVDMGELSTDIALTYGDTPRLIRTIPTGLNSLVKAVAQNLSVQEDQARQFILKFGLDQSRLEGQVFRAVEMTLDNFASELSKSIKFFQNRYEDVAVSQALLSGYGATVPQIDSYLAGKINISAVATSPWQNINVSQSMQQQLAPIANEFATAVGLAKRRNLS